MDKVWLCRVGWTAVLVCAATTGQATPPRNIKTTPAPPPRMSAVLSQPVVQVPIRVTEQGEILFMVNFGSGPVECQLDTGTFLTRWDDRYQFAGTPLGKTKTLYATDSEMADGEVVQIKTVSVGGAVFKNVPTTASDYKKMEGGAKTTASLRRPLVGWSLFAQQAICIDYKAETLLIGQPKKIRARLKNAYAVPLKYVGDLKKGLAPSVVAECQIAGMAFDAMVDTGNTSGFTAVNASSWAKLRDRIVAQKGADAINSFDDPAYPNAKQYTADDIAVALLPKASKTFPTALCGVFNLPVGTLNFPTHEVNIGWEYLHHFIVTFDFENSMLYLEEQTIDEQKP